MCWHDRGLTGLQAVPVTCSTEVHISMFLHSDVHMHKPLILLPPKTQSYPDKNPEPLTGAAMLPQIIYLIVGMLCR